MAGKKTSSKKGKGLATKILRIDKSKGMNTDGNMKKIHSTVNERGKQSKGERRKRKRDQESGKRNISVKEEQDRN